MFVYISVVFVASAGAVQYHLRNVRVRGVF
jgi:hypothetical protein